MEHLPEKGYLPKVWVFFCECCLSLPDIEKSVLSIMFPANVETVREMCIGNSSPAQIRQAFETGADGVLLCGCQVGRCHNTDNLGMLRIIHQNQILLKNMGLEPQRLGQVHLAPGCPNSLRNSVTDFIAKIEKLGPLSREQLQENQSKA